jgi:hypothetical protein
MVYSGGLLRERAMPRSGRITRIASQHFYRQFPIQEIVDWDSREFVSLVVIAANYLKAGISAYFLTLFSHYFPII